MRLLNISVLCLGLMGCRQASGHEGSEPDALTLARGVEVYKEQGCGICHTLSRAGTGGVFGPPHDGVGDEADLRVQDPTYHGGATTGEEYLKESVLDPTAYRVPGYERTRFAMPAYTGIPEQDLAALVAMLAGDRRKK